jgi:hypothetical protein
MGKQQGPFTLDRVSTGGLAHGRRRPAMEAISHERGHGAKAQAQTSANSAHNPKLPPFSVQPLAPGPLQTRPSALICGPR